jgi:hypothetical protein
MTEMAEVAEPSEKGPAVEFPSAPMADSAPPESWAEGATLDLAPASEGSGSTDKPLPEPSMWGTGEDGEASAPSVDASNADELESEPEDGAADDVVDDQHGADQPAADEPTDEAMLPGQPNGEWEDESAVTDGDAGAEPTDQVVDQDADDTTADSADAAGGVGGKTDVGWEFLPEKDKQYSQDVPKYPDEYVLDLHGSPDSVQVGEDPKGAAEFAQLVKSQSDWDGKTPIRLFSCYTGADPEGFAQQLSNELGVQVTAPTEPVWSVKSGEPVVTAADPDTGEPIDPPTGSWVNFQPQGR